MKRFFHIVYFSTLVVVLMTTMLACSDGDDEKETYPSMVTELVTYWVDGALRMKFVTDDGAIYTVSNTLDGLKPYILGRMVCGYVPQDDGLVEVYSYQPIRLLQDFSTKAPSIICDPVGVVSVWKKSHFINMHLLPKTKSNPLNHDWGFVRSNKRPNLAGGVTHELSLYHSQKEDPLAYSSDVYLTLVVDSVSKTFGANDSIEITVQGFDKAHLWRFGK